MTNQENKIPIKGYATFDPLKHCWIGSGFKTEWFRDLPIYKNDKIMDPLKRIAEETEEDYQTLEQLLQSAGVKTYRAELDIDNFKSLRNIFIPPACPRDNFGVIGNKLYAIGDPNLIPGYKDILMKISKENLVLRPRENAVISTAQICRVGKDIWWDVDVKVNNETLVEKYRSIWEEEGFRVHTSTRGYHSDGSFCVVKPGCIVSLKDIQDYKTEFPGWDVLYLPDQSWDKVNPFMELKEKVGGRWWLKGEEHNNQLIEFVNTWLNDWVGYV